MIHDITSQGSMIDEAYIDFIFADPNDQAHAWAINQATLKSRIQKSNNNEYEQTGEKRTTAESLRSENTNTTK